MRLLAARLSGFVAVITILLIPSVFAGALPGARADVFVATNGKDSWSGTLAAPNSGKTDGPFASLARAQAAVHDLVKAGLKKPVTVMLREGTYYLPLSATSPGTLIFGAGDSGTPAAPVRWQNYPGETPVVSGGEPIGKGGLGVTWTHVSGSLWQVQLPARTQPFEYLFYNGERRLRSRLESPSGVGYYMKDGVCYSTATKESVGASMCNLGTFLRIAEEIPPTGANAGCPSVTAQKDKTKSKCLDRFGYNPSDPIASWANLNASGSQCGGASSKYPVGDVEVTIFVAWTVDVMRVSCVDTKSHVIYFTAPTKRNPGLINFFGPTLGHRYVVENTREAFDAASAAGQTGLWFLDRSTSGWTLNYLANRGENPNADSVVIAQVSPVSTIGGSLISATNLSNVTFKGITFEVDNYIPPPSGFNNDVNSENALPEAIDCESCQHVTFDGIVVRRTSASAILIASKSSSSGPPASNDMIQNSAFYDLGDSGIRIGHNPSGSDKAASVVQSILVQNNLVQGYSRVFPDGEGMAQANGRDITYLHNDIDDGYQAGISVCLLGCPPHDVNGTNIVSQYNHIWNIKQGITSDGGTLYYNVGSATGSGTGNKMLNNLVHDSTDSSVIDAGVRGSAYGGSGIYLDNHSAGVDVENNVVYNVAASALWHSEGVVPGQPPNRINNNIFAYAREAMFNENTPWAEGCGSTVREQVTNNIFYFDRDDSSQFYVIQGCADSCGLDYDKFLNFQGNLYWRTDGKFASDPKAFHVATKAVGNPRACSFTKSTSNWTFLTFSQWQDGKPLNGIPKSMNEDKTGTVTVDPGFGHTGKPADFLLTKNPIPGFDYTKTNDTIRNAGRNHPVIMPPAVPATFPTYNYTSF